MMDILSHLKGPGKILSIPVNFSHNFAPAEICLYEWQDYWLELSGIDYIFVGGQLQKPHIEGTHIFRLRFENQLGLTEIQPFCDSRPLCPPLALEVISGKFSSPERHLAFFQSLLSDLFLRAANLPFTISAPTMQNAVEAFRPPTPLFILHFLHQFAKPLREAIEVVLSNPHRLLSDRVEKLPVFEANEV
ncbi:MAG TPA: hypothetical protein PKD55_26170, partial [Bellilinea sp.]|nr:hypothetical protein [Bellilinea sp.]